MQSFLVKLSSLREDFEELGLLPKKDGKLVQEVSALVSRPVNSFRLKLRAQKLEEWKNEIKARASKKTREVTEDKWTKRKPTKSALTEELDEIEKIAKATKRIREQEEPLGKPPVSPEEEKEKAKAVLKKVEEIAEILGERFEGDFSEAMAKLYSVSESLAEEADEMDEAELEKQVGRVVKELVSAIEWLLETNAFEPIKPDDPSLVYGVPKEPGKRTASPEPDVVREDDEEEE